MSRLKYLNTMKTLLALFLILLSPSLHAQFGGQQIISTAGNSPRSIFIADMDGNGAQDVLVASTGDDMVAWYKNAGSGNFSGPQIISATLSDTRFVYSADLDGDLDMDVISISGSEDKVVWFENMDGLGNFGSEILISSLTDGSVGVHAADIDGDGDQDVLSASLVDNKIAWYENLDGLGSFGVQQIITTASFAARDVKTADLDGDGDQDVMAASSGADEVIWFENTDGLGTFGPLQVITNNADGVISIFAIDLDGDLDIDILSASLGDSKIAWYENTNGMGTFSSEQIITTALSLQNKVFATDLDNDGDIDVLSSAPGTDVIAWYENTDGAGTFGSPQIITTEIEGARGVMASDLDNDGDMDVVSVSSIDDKIAWYENFTILGINDNLLNDVVIVPNPANDHVEVQTKYTSLINQVTVHSILGETLLTMPITKKWNKQIDVSTLSHGVYIVTLETDSGSFTSKLIKE